MKQPRYLVSKAWGYGFFSDVMVTLGHLLIAELTGRTPVVYWGSNSLFKTEAGGNAFTSFFQPVNDVRLQDLEVPGLSFFPGKWNYKNLRKEDHQKWEGVDARMHGCQYFDRPEDVVVCDFYTAFPEIASYIPRHSAWVNMEVYGAYYLLINKYLKPLPSIVTASNSARAKLIGDRAALAVHFRGTDQAKEIVNYDMNLLLDAFSKGIDTVLKARHYECIYLMTDDSRALDHFKKEYGPSLVATDTARSSGLDGLHHLNPCMQLGKEVLIDTLIALGCDSFLGSGLSNPSCFIRFAKDWQGNAMLLRENKLARKNEFIYQRVGTPSL